MEHNPQEHQEGRSDHGAGNRTTEFVQSHLNKIDDSNENQVHQRDYLQDIRADTQDGQNVKEDVPTAYDNTQGEVNIEASISADDVLRAGGFGARDDISSFLPVACDFTDFEASLLDARVYEEPKEETSRPGLGWTKSEK